MLIIIAAKIILFFLFLQSKKIKQMKMKKNTIVLIVALVLILLATVVMLYENGVWFNANKAFSSDSFAIKDTSKVTKIFMADKYGFSVLLTRTNNGWTVQDTLTAMPEKIESLLSIMMNIRVKNSVPLNAQSNINSILSYSGIKVEVFEKRPKFKLFGLQFGEKEKIIKVYYMGPATQDNVSNYAYLEGMNEPCIVYIPGFRGFLTPQYSVEAEEWISQSVFATKLTRIEKLEITDFIEPEESFTVEKTGPRFFNLYNGQQQLIAHYDTTRLIDMLSEYRNRNFEYVVKDLSQEKIDSILTYNLWKKIKLTNTDGEEKEITLYKKKYIGYFDITKEDSSEEKPAWDADRFFITIGKDKNTLYSMQFYHFGRQTLPLSYFLKNESGK